MSEPRTATGTESAAPRRSGDGAGSLLARAILADVSRFRWVVVVVVALSLAGGAVAAGLAPPSYTGRSSLIVSSTYRSPDQDAVLVQGYVELFDETYQDRVLAAADLPSGVELAARSAAASPIMIIEATADDPDVAAAAATAAADVFRTDVNEVRDDERNRQILELQNRLRARLRVEGGGASSVTQLREELLRVQADQTDQVQVLQSSAGVESDEPDVVRTVGASLVGGLGLGIVAALACGWLQRRSRRR